MIPKHTEVVPALANCFKEVVQILFVEAMRGYMVMHVHLRVMPDVPSVFGKTPLDFKVLSHFPTLIADRSLLG
jgi:hypothetical protein